MPVPTILWSVYSMHRYHMCTNRTRVHVKLHVQHVYTTHTHTHIHVSLVPQSHWVPWYHIIGYHGIPVGYCDFHEHHTALPLIDPTPTPTTRLRWIELRSFDTNRDMFTAIPWLNGRCPSFKCSYLSRNIHSFVVRLMAIKKNWNIVNPATNGKTIIL